MPADRYDLTARQTVVTVETGPARPPVVAVEYDGLAPPMDLLSCLRLVGFEGLVPQPPPSGAIEWGGDGSVSPTAPTILPFRAMVRSGFSGSPECAERAADAARLVLDRLAPDRLAGPSGEPAASPAPRGSLAAAVLATTRERVATLTERPPPPDRRPSTEPATSRASGSTDDDATSAGATSGWDIQVVADPEDADDVRALLAAHGAVLEEVPVTWTAEVAYRGQRSETHHRAVRLVAVVDEASRDTLLAALSRRRLRSVELSG